MTRILWLCLLSVLTHLFNTKYADASASSLYILMNDFRFVAALLLMRDVLPLMRKMSLELQKRCPDFYVLMVTIPNIIQHVEAMIENPGTEYCKLDLAIKWLANEGHHVRYGSSIHRRVFEECRKDFLKALVAHLRVNIRFKEMPVIGSLYRMLTPRLYKGKTLAEVQNCKQLQKAFDEVAAHFCSEGRDSPLKKEELEVEWKFILKVVWEARDATVKVKVPADP